MSFFTSKTWSKIPTDLLENKQMQRAEKLLTEQGLSSYLPVMLYLAGASNADADGIFDVEDGSYFAELIKVDSPAIVFKVLNIMVGLRVVAHVPESSVYLFSDWEYPQSKPDKDIEKRFMLACSFWKQKKSHSSFFRPQMSEKVDTIRKEIKNNPDTVNEYTENYTQPIQDNKMLNQDNRQIRVDKIREDETRAEEIIPEVEKNTHTREESVGEEIPPETSESLIDSPVSGYEKSKDSEDSENIERLMSVPDWEILPENNTSETPFADSANKETGDASSVPTNYNKNEGDLNKLIEQLNGFFSENNVAYNVKKGTKVVKMIANELLSTTQAPQIAADLAEKICFEFKKMHDAPKSDHWHNIPLFPVYMAKDAVWSQLLSRVSRIYGITPEQKQSSLEQDYKDWLQERKNMGDMIDAEYIRLGISPDDPARAAKLLQAKAGCKS